MINLLVVCIAAFGAGFLEWFIATKRMLALLAQKRLLVGLLVFLEVYIAFLLSLIAIKEFSTGEAVCIFALYSLGGGVGSIIPLRKKESSSWAK